MLKEIEKAVEIFHSIAFGTKNNASKLPEDKLAVFVSVLTELLTVRYEKNWFPENPERGSGYRCIRVNTQSIDPTIVESLKRAKIDLIKGLISTEVTIWVDPGVVSVRIGEDGSIGPIVVDEEVYNTSRQAQENSLKDSDEGFSSRSSSPQSSISDLSRSGSPYMSSSPLPTKYVTSPSPPAVEYNPYSPPVHVSYPSLHQHPAASLPPQQPMRNLSPKASYLQPHVVRPHSRSITPFSATMVSSSSSDLFSHIPVSAAQLAAAYTHPRTLFSSHDSSSSSGAVLDGIGKMAFNPYQAMPMMYGGSLAQTNFYDIPAMA